MAAQFNDSGLEALFFDSCDALTACVEERDIKGALLRLENMHHIIKLLKDEVEPGITVREWRLVDTEADFLGERV